MSLDDAMEENRRMAKRPKKVSSGQATSEDDAKKHSAEGGFVVRCKDDTTVTVSPEQSRRLQQSCKFFYNAFRHGTTEAASGVLSKPDWTAETARSIMALIADGKCEIPRDYLEFHEASKQICVPLRVCHPVHGSNIADNGIAVEAMSTRWSERKSQFVLETRLLSSTDAADKWNDLLLSGITMLRDEQDLVVTLGGQKKEDNDGSAQGKQHEYTVGAVTPLCISAFHTCFYLSDCKYDDGKHKEFQLLFRLNFGAGKFLEHALGVSVDTFATKQSELVRISGTFEELQKVMSAVPDLIVSNDKFKIGMLRVNNPNSVTLGKFITASQKCVKHPSSLGWKVDEKMFYALKTLSDLEIILKALADASTEVAMGGSFHLTDHSLSKGWIAF